MKLLLKKRVQDLGELGDLVEVRAGFGRNYLIPNGLAIEVNSANLLWFEAQKRRLLQVEAETLEQVSKVAERLNATSCTIIARATEEGHLFGSVTSDTVIEHLKQDGIEIDPSTLILEKPIKELGIYTLVVDLHPEVKAELKVWVVKGDEDST